MNEDDLKFWSSYFIGSGDTDDFHSAHKEKIFSLLLAGNYLYIFSIKL
jgi:hypothetical protein